MSTPYSQGARPTGARAGDGQPSPDGPRPAGGPPDRRFDSAGDPAATSVSNPEPAGWAPDPGAAARRRAAAGRDGGDSTSGRRAAGRGGPGPSGPDSRGPDSRGPDTRGQGSSGPGDQRAAPGQPARPTTGPRNAGAGADAGPASGGRGFSDRAEGSRSGSRQTGAERTGSGRVLNPRSTNPRSSSPRNTSAGRTPPTGGPARGDVAGPGPAGGPGGRGGSGRPQPGGAGADSTALLNGGPAADRPSRPVAGRAAAARARATGAAGAAGAAGATAGAGGSRSERLSGATTRLRAYRPGGGRQSPSDQPPGQVNALYDTVDQAALRRVDVHERTADATVYRKVTPGGAAVDGIDSLDSLDRDGRSGMSAARMGGAEGRRPGGPQGPGGRTGPRSATNPTGARAAVGGRGNTRRNVGRHGPRWWRNRPRWFRRLVLASFLSGSLLFVAGLAVIYAATRIPLPDEVKTDQTSIITWAGGGEITRIGTVNRTDVPLSQVSKDVQHAVLAAENKDFYSEPGISPKGIARAMWVNVTGGEIAQGGSTITQQYVKNAYLTQDRTFTRKMREIVMAVKISRKYSKDEILEFYLNTIYFGRGAYGIEAASKAYFNKPASQLTAGEGAVIAGLIRSPNYLDPKENPADAEARWKDVVATMVAEGWAPASLANEKPPAVIDKNEGSSYTSSDQVGYIRDQVLNELDAKGITEDQINRGGLRITTTLDEAKQTAAFQAVSKEIGTAYAAVPELRTGLVAVKPGTGEVLAWYGGSLYGKGENGQEQYEDNVSTAEVQPGSTFKTITLVAALKAGISLKSTYHAPAHMNIGTYEFSNDESEPGDLGYPDLIESTAESINTVYVPLGNDIGVNNIIETAHDMGIDADTKLEDVAGVTLGKDGVTALEMTDVYSTLASGGYQATPHIVATVEDNSGEVILRGGDSAQTSKDPVIPPSVARDATYALQAVIDHGTGTKAKLADNRPAAGKTGTTDNFRSAWFCGYTKEIASCVNMFRGQGRESDQLRGIPGVTNGVVYGGTYPARIWKAFMDAALKGEPIKQFDPPAYGGSVTLRSPSPTPEPTPSDLPSQTPVGGTDDWDIFGDNENRTSQSRQTSRATSGTSGQQTTRPQPTRSPTGIVGDIFGGH
ncbi:MULTISPECIES: transglycosylase domain-containing protein [Parafrankia]|uniref:transglycosylase domain-containing protein n=1 Tax=Parafrankia TaxID=2994362 RepID=UPI0013F4EF3B|nr:MULTISPECIES: transglycosylase domain-containing protein [Parafrankia]MBE3204322.1 transglycosylase domain-containing protein [Parafrankia sp. CH37]